MPHIANASTKRKERGEIVITPEMIAAGAAVLEHDPIAGDRIVAPLDLAEEVLRAGLSVRCRETTKASG